jgi:hypothetical protein
MQYPAEHAPIQFDVQCSGSNKNLIKFAKNIKPTVLTKDDFLSSFRHFNTYVCLYNTELNLNSSFNNIQFRTNIKVRPLKCRYTMNIFLISP